MAETQETWHRGSRFYRLGGHALYISATFVYLAMYFHPEAITEAFGVFGGIGALILGGSTWTNLKERDISRAQVQAGVTITGEEGL
jgi:hypothetical protein